MSIPSIVSLLRKTMACSTYKHSVLTTAQLCFKRGCLCTHSPLSSARITQPPQGPRCWLFIVHFYVLPSFIPTASVWSGYQLSIPALVKRVASPLVSHLLCCLGCSCSSQSPQSVSTVYNLKTLPWSLMEPGSCNVWEWGRVPTWWK